jgi:hypothetical protein
MRDDETRRLRERLLSARDHAGAEHARRAMYVLRAHGLERIGRTLDRAGLRAMLVKGAALALTAYSPPWSRDMDDVDLLVRERDRGAVASALVDAGCVAAPAPPGRPLTSDALGELVFGARFGAASFTLELHTRLDKIVPRGVAYDDVLARGAPAPELPGFMVPAPEDHALLVALHLAGHEYRHAVGLLDLHLLLARGLSRDVLCARADAYRLRAALYVALATLRALGSSEATPPLLARLDPGPLRRAAIARVYDLGRYPVARGAPRLGLPWLARQAVLRDDLAPFAASVLRYAAERGFERAGLASARR